MSLFKRNIKKLTLPKTNEIGFAYNDIVVKDYVIPTCWEEFKTAYIKHFEALLMSTNPDAYNVDFQRSHIEKEFEKALNLINQQQAEHQHEVLKIKTDREAFKVKCLAELDDLQSVYDKSVERINLYIELKESKNRD